MLPLFFGSVNSNTLDVTQANRNNREVKCSNIADSYSLDYLNTDSRDVEAGEEYEVKHHDTPIRSACLTYTHSPELRVNSCQSVRKSARGGDRARTRKLEIRYSDKWKFQELTPASIEEPPRRVKYGRGGRAESVSLSTSEADKNSRRYLTGGKKIIKSVKESGTNPRRLKIMSTGVKNRARRLLETQRIRPLRINGGSGREVILPQLSIQRNLD